MINGKFTEFIDQLYYGQELVFLFNEKKYFLQGWWNEDRSTTMVLEDVSDDALEGYLWEYHSDSMQKCAEAFLSAPIWGGKCFPQIESDVTWSDW